MKFIPLIFLFAFSVVAQDNSSSVSIPVNSSDPTQYCATYTSPDKSWTRSGCSKPEDFSKLLCQLGCPPNGEDFMVCHKDCQNRNGTSTNTSATNVSVNAPVKSGTVKVDREAAGLTGLMLALAITSLWL